MSAESERAGGGGPLPAPVLRRLLAGLVDGVVVLALVVICFWFHVTRAGSTAPLWTVAGLALVWNVLPAWATGSTLGLRLFGLRLIGVDGSDPDLIELAIRELFGRGVVFIAYISGFLLALIGSLLGLGIATSVPVGLALLLLSLALMLLGLSALGQVMILLRADGRSGADLISKLRVVSIEPSTAAGVDGEDEEETEEEKNWRSQSAHRRWLWAGLLGVVCLALAVGAPLLDNVRFTTDPYARAHELKEQEELNTLRLRFDQTPADPVTAERLARGLRQRGLRLDASAVLDEHRDALAEHQRVEEDALLTRLARGDDWDALWELLDLYRGQDRLDEGRGIFAEFVESSKDPEDRLQRQASYGVWLHRADFDDEAVTVLQAAINGGWQTGQVYAYLGLALRDLDRLPEARKMMREAIKRDAGLEDDLGWRLEAINAELRERRRKRR